MSVEQVNQLRKKTSYPKFRKLIYNLYFSMNCVLALSLLSVVFVLVPGIFNVADGKGTGLLWLSFELFVSSLVTLVILKVWYELTMLLIDIADSVLYSAYSIYVLTSKQTKDA